jgi:glycosyltransferase involved in cell wall biosynthesis
MSPKVSVVVKSYNHAPYVAQTIESVLDQSFQDFEIVVTDDGSTDGTPDVVRQFQDPRVKLDVLPRNHGISIAMNSVLARARGEYIAILNSDDYALPGRLERQVAFLEDRPDISALFGLPQAVDEEGHERAPFNDFDRPLAFPDFNQATWLNSLFFKGNCLCAPTAMIRRSVYEFVGHYDPRLTNLQDFDMWIRMLKSGHRFFLLPERFTAFRIRNGHKNMSAPRSDSRLRHAFELTRILKQYSSMEPELLLQVFSSEMARAGIETGIRPELLLAHMALTVRSPAYGLFALQLLFDKAEGIDDFDRLRDLTGRLDIFRALAMQDCREELAKLNGLLAAKKYF